MADHNFTWNEEEWLAISGWQHKVDARRRVAVDCNAVASIKKLSADNGHREPKGPERESRPSHGASAASHYIIPLTRVTKLKCLKHNILVGIRPRIVRRWAMRSANWQYAHRGASSLQPACTTGFIAVFEMLLDHARNTESLAHRLVAAIPHFASKAGLKRPSTSTCEYGTAEHTLVCSNPTCLRET